MFTTAQRGARRHRFVTLSLLLLLLASTVMTAFAQIEPQRYYVYQNDRLVGLIFQPQRAAGQNTFSQHWILFPNYVYPGSATQAKIKLVPMRSTGETLTEEGFFRSAPWGTGYRYVHVVNHEQSLLPVR